MRHGYSGMTEVSRVLGCLTGGYSVLTDFIVLLSTLWENSPSCHHGAECQLQIHQGWGEYGSVYTEITCIPALFGSGRLLAELPEGLQCMTNGAKFLAVLMLGLLGTQHYRCSREVLESTEKA